MKKHKHEKGKLVTLNIRDGDSGFVVFVVFLLFVFGLFFLNMKKNPGSDGFTAKLKDFL